jgi:hypothetical protein
MHLHFDAGSGKVKMGENSSYELNDAKLDARRLYRNSRRKATYATLAFLLSCCSVVPFLNGHRLHAYWEVFGKYLVLLSMALLLPFVIFNGIAVSTWIYKRNVESIREDDD